MAISVTLNGGGSIIAWQTPSGISFQRFTADHRPIGDVTSVATGPTAWLSAQALANGGFSIIWNVNASTVPTVQSYDAAGAASGSTFSIGTPPSADIAFTSRASAQTADVFSPASTPLLDGGYVTASLGHADNNVNLPVVRVQRYDAAGTPLGADFEIQGSLDQFTNPKIVPMADGGYVVSFLHITGHSSSLDVARFDANGTVLGQTTPILFAGGIAFPGVLTHTVAALPNGGFVVCWTTSADNQMHSREYNSAAQATSAEHVLGDATTSTAATIDVFSDGDYVVSWSYPSGTAFATFTTAGSPTPAADNDLITTIAPTYMLPVGPHDVTLIRNGAQSVIGNVLNNIITSNDYVSTLNGHAGNDTLITGHNANILTGGPGADVFKFLYLPWNNTGHVTDFASGTDRLDFSALFAAVGYGGGNPLSDGYVRLQLDGAGGTRILFDSDGNGPGSSLVLVTTLDHIASTALTTTQLFNPSSGPPPPPPPPPTGGQTFTANNTRDQILVGGTGDDTFYTGHNSVVLTGDGGADRYVFQYVPWNNTGHITDFALGIDRLDFTALFAAAHYTGTNPLADGYIRFESDGHGGTRVLFDSDGPGGSPWPFLITTLDHLSPTGLTATQLFSSGGTPPPPPPPTSGQTLTGNDTRGQILTGGSGDDLFYAGHNSVVMTGDGGADRYVFQYLPWNGARITDFASGSDVLDLRPLFSASHYAGTNPIGDGYLRFESDGAGGTNVMFDPDGPATGNRWAFTIVTLDHVQPNGVHTGDWLYA
jgi:hypothetical protein